VREKILEALEIIGLQEQQLKRQKAKLLRELYDASAGIETEEKYVYSLEEIKEFEDCAFKFKCPMDWDNLEETDDVDVKYCSVCEENVYHAPNLLEFKQRVKEKQCVSIRNNEDDILMGVPMFINRMKDDDMIDVPTPKEDK
jgi:hypothetical protein